MANSVDPDETPRSAASHLDLYCLLRPICPSIYGKYGIICYANEMTSLVFFSGGKKRKLSATILNGNLMAPCSSWRIWEYYIHVAST